jgi:hypothetical protein
LRLWLTPGPRRAKRETEPSSEVCSSTALKSVAVPFRNATWLSAAQGFDALATTPEDSASRVKLELARWAKVIHDAKIEPQ